MKQGLFSFLVGAGLALALLSIPGSVSADTTMTDLEFAQLRLKNCQLELQYATTSGERTRANQCITIQRKVIAGLMSGAPTTSQPTSSTSTPQPTSTSQPTGTSTSPPVTTTTTTVPTTTTNTTTAPPSQTPQPQGDWPNLTNTGVPAFWQPVQTRSTNLTISTNGAVVEDILFTNGADLFVTGDNVTVRRLFFQGGRINSINGSDCGRGLRIENTTFKRPSGTVGSSDQEGIVTPGGYTADRVQVDGVIEGFRVGGKSNCGGVNILNSFIRIQAPDSCNDWHGDGIQGYDGGALVVRNVTIDFQERSGCGGTAPFFYPHSQGNTSVDIDRLIVKGGGFSFRNGMPGRVVNLKIVEDWGYGPINVRCSVMNEWQAQIATVDANWNPTNVRNQPCNTEEGN